MSNDSLHPFQSEAHYRLLREKLVAYLDRRSCTASEDLADEALARLIKKAITCQVVNVDAAAHVTAKNVFHEWLRQSGRFVCLENEPADDATPGSQRSRMIAAVAVGGLKADDREFLEQYFVDNITAEELASQLGTTPVAVRGRAFRLRQQIKTVMEVMMAEGTPSPVLARSAAA